MEFLKKVACGSVEEVKSFMTENSSFDPNVTNQENKSALTVAIENKDIEMCKLLVCNYKVSSVNDMFYHVRFAFSCPRTKMRLY